MTSSTTVTKQGKKNWQPNPDITAEELTVMREDVLERIVVARVGLLLRHPFFGNMATRLRIKEADDWIPTAAVDGRNLYFNTQFFNAMDNKEIINIINLLLNLLIYQLTNFLRFGLKYFGPFITLPDSL